MINVFTTKFNVDVQSSENIVGVIEIGSPIVQVRQLTDNQYVVRVGDTQQTVTVNEAPDNVVSIVQNGTPIIKYGDNTLFVDRLSYWSSDEKIAVSGLGEYYNSSYKPILIFENGIQKFELEGSARIVASGSAEPFKIENQSAESLFKITTDELPVFKVHTVNKTPVEGALFFKDGDLFFGAS